MKAIDFRIAQYLYAATGAIEDGRLDTRYHTNWCTECDEEVHAYDEGKHIIMTLEGGPGEPDNVVVLLVGCEDYLFIPPAQIGLGDAYPNWQDWTETAS